MRRFFAWQSISGDVVPSSVAMAFSTASGSGLTSGLTNGSSVWASGGGLSAKGLQGGGGEDAGGWGGSEAGEPRDPVSGSWEAGPWALKALGNCSALG